MTRKQRRLTMIGGSLAVLAVAAALVLNAMRDSIASILISPNFLYPIDVNDPPAAPARASAAPGIPLSGYALASRLRPFAPATRTCPISPLAVIRSTKGCSTNFLFCISG